MEVRRLLPFCVLLVAMTKLSVAQNPSYLVYFPKFLRPGFPIQIVAEILKNPNPVKLTALLFSPAKELNFQLEAKISEGETKFLSFKEKIPIDYAGTTDFNMTVIGTDSVTNKTLFENTTNSLVFKRKALSIFVQTDKGIYKPTQTIKFRAVVTMPDLLPYGGNISYKVTDPKQNILLQTKNAQPVLGVIASEFLLDRYAEQGDWKIAFTANEYEKSVTVSVEEYKLPKFEVEIKAAQSYLYEGSFFSGKFSAKFTFGQPVKGGSARLVFKIASRYGYGRSIYMDDYYIPHSAEPYVEKYKEFTGEQAFNFSASHLMEKLNQNSFYNKLEVVAYVTDPNSGVELSDTITVDLISKIQRIKVEQILVPKTIKPGLQYTAYLKVTKYDGQPISEDDRTSLGLKVRAQTNYQDWNRRTDENIPVTIQTDGMIILTMTARNDNFTRMTFSVEWEDHWLENWSADRFDSPSGMYIQITTEQSNLTPGQNAALDVRTTTADKVYTITMLSRGEIVHQETYAPASSTEEESISKFSYEFSVTEEMSPSVTIVIFFMGAKGEIVSDSITLQVEYIFKNKVDVKTSTQRTETGKPITVTVKTSPDSLVALRAIDRSVILQKEGNDITSENILEDLEGYGTESMVRRRRWWYPMPIEGSNSWQLFKSSGFIVFTDAVTFMNQSISNSPNIYYEEEYEDNMVFDGPPIMAMMPAADENHILYKGQEDGAGATVVQRGPVVQTRKNFPETWIWNEWDVGKNGSRTFSFVLPDTATTWEISAFAISEMTGLGVAEPDPQIIATRDFFISLDLPISMVSGEELIMKATVYNFFDHDIDATLTLEESEWYEATNTSSDASKSGAVRKISVKSKEGTTERFTMRFLKHGDAVIKVNALSETVGDRIERTIPVKPEGIQSDISRSVLVERSDETADDTVEKFSINIPENIVEGSAYGKIFVSGNVMGNAMSNLGALLKWPTGCGEQTMLSFAPDVYVSSYLQKVGRLEGSVEAKSRKHIQQGYTNELRYQHDDGSFSAFGNSDKYGSTWLTAFVAKCFISAMELSGDMLDASVSIDRAIAFLLTKQQKDGSFKEDGNVCHQDMQGGVGNRKKHTMTAYVVAAMTEGGYNLKRKDLGQAVEKAKKYLETNVDTSEDTFALAIVTYALVLSGSEKVPEFITVLEDRAQKFGKWKYWAMEEEEQPQCDHPWEYQCWKSATSSDIEITSYILLSLIRLGRTSELMPVVKWLVKQRGSFGGYRSTQDTVMAIQALSLFAGLYADRVLDMDLTVTHSADSDFTAGLKISPGNSIILQSEELPPVSGNVSVAASGVGFADVQVSYLYNIPIDDKLRVFDVDIDFDISKGYDHVKMKVCTSVNMNRDVVIERTGMFIVAFGLPSGYRADDRVALSANPNAKLIELVGSEMTVYFDELVKGQTLCFGIDLERLVKIAGVKPQMLRASDYYKPDQTVVQRLEIPGLQNMGACEVCFENCYGCPAGEGHKTSFSLLIVTALTVISTIFLLE